MFKSISYKIVAMFVLLTISVVIVIGTFMINKTSSFYLDEFVSLMNNVLDTSFISSIEAKSADDDFLQYINQSMSAYTGQMGIDSFRNYYILDAKTGKPVFSSDTEQNKNIEITSNIIAAMRGRYGNTVSSAASYMDFAAPIKNNSTGQVSYIIYVKDTKDESNSVVKNIFSIIFQALGMGILLSFAFGFLLSKTIIAPITSLTHKAKQLAEGDFDYIEGRRSRDELGNLTQTFNHMAKELRETLFSIQSEKEKVETILLYMTDGVVAFDADGELIHINPAALRMLSLAPNDNYPAFDAFFKDIDISMAQLSFLKSNETIEKDIKKDNVELKVYFAKLAMVNSANDKMGGVVVVLQDITEQQKLESSRREFVANVSHELRTPLTTVKSYAETLSFDIENGEFSTEDALNYLNVINNESDRMTRLVKDLLLLSRLDHVIKSDAKRKVDISHLISKIVRNLNFTAKEKSQSLTYKPLNDLPKFLCDPDRIEQVIINIITNAIKYTPNGGEIVITSFFMYGKIHIKIKDNGIGIPEKDIPYIFERFYRVDKARSRKQGGTGLGLAIAKEIINEAGGTISISSKVNVGTEVIISLPA